MDVYHPGLLLNSSFLVLLFDIPLVRMKGLEPPYLTASDPKSDVSTNFTTSGISGPEP
jgi:hypothetical protein